ncbi:kinase domain-containing protein [Favolaschia claudopus]|uniref:Kinase domain-containing protein n=1 Tax=Favolaschia claudopus TaxID=2862362 RepID=A0AAW0EJP7_9AGAR
MTTIHTQSQTPTASSSGPVYYQTYTIKDTTEAHSRPRSSSSRSRVGDDNQPAPRPTLNYVLGESIGKGSYARVYLALNASNGELIAVKRVEAPQTASDRADSRQLEMVRALKFESQTLKDLTHPNIVQYLGFEETAETLNIFLEYVPGGTIASCLQKHGRFNQDVTKWFTKQILEGLEYLHSTGILHRDLKGDNILVELSGVCKISDFGISKRQDLAGQAHTQMKGTAFWMAPEIIDANGQRGYDSKIDIWSVGCVVLEMWSGERPWAGHEWIPVMLQLFTKKQAPPLREDIRAGLSDLALDFRDECFAINPQERPGAALLLGHPYLQQTPEWSFHISEIERSNAHHSGRREHRSRHRNSSAPASRHHRRSATEPDAPPVPTINGDYSTRRSDHLRPPSLDNGTLRPDSRTLRPATHQRSLSRPPSQSSSNEPPPIVFITPPSSPVRTSSRNSVSPATSESTRTSGSLRPRKSGFFIANPDPEPGDKPRVTVYAPPPLPAGQAPPRPSTSHLFSQRHALQSRSVADLHAGERRLASARSMQQLASRVGSSSRQSLSSRNGTHYSDSDSDSNAGTSLWMKPPMELKKARAVTSPTLTNGDQRRTTYSESDSDSHSGTMWKKPPIGTFSSATSSKSRKHAHRKSIIESKRDSTWAPRPGVGDVYSHLDKFFPAVNLDKPLVAPGVSDRQRKTKSLRMTAEEYNRDPGIQRSRTKLWDHRVQEVPAERLRLRDGLQ